MSALGREALGHAKSKASAGGENEGTLAGEAEIHGRLLGGL
jgi:hypothetical protein